MPRELLRLSGKAIVLVCVVGLLSAWPSLHWGGSENIQALIAAGAVTLIASIVSMIPITMAVAQKSDWLGQACLGATVIRLMVTMLLGCGWYVAAKPPMTAFLLWTMLFYLVLLVWETKIAMRYVKRFYGEMSERVNE